MASINAGHTTFGAVFSAAKFNVDKKTAADYNNGASDYRRVQVGGLPYNGNPDEVLFIPPSATELVITLDGQEAFKFDLKLDDYWEQERAELIDVSGLDPDAPASESDDSDK